VAGGAPPNQGARRLREDIGRVRLPLPGTLLEALADPVSGARRAVGAAGCDFMRPGDPGVTFVPAGPYPTNRKCTDKCDFPTMT
jgi:hypothetical protein